MNYTANLIHEGYASTLLAVFASCITLVGLALDAYSLRLRVSKTLPAGHTVGLPFVPWMLYFLASFFWFLHGSLALAGGGLALLTVWHIAVHARRLRGSR